MKNVIRNHYFRLKESTESCLQTIADRMYSKGLINCEVRNSPTFEKIELNFLTLVSFCTEDVALTRLEEKCLKFLSCFIGVEGPAKEVAVALARDWEREVFQDQKLSFPLIQEKLTIEQPEIKVSCRDNLVKELDRLQKKFSSLLVEIRTFYDTKYDKQNIIKIARWIEEYLDVEGMSSLDVINDGMTIDNLFHGMKPHYNFIEIDLIKNLIEEYPINSYLQSQFDQYSQNLEEFIEVAELGDVISSIEAALTEQEGYNVDPKVVIKLLGRWERRTLENLQKLTKYLFRDNAKYLTIKQAKPGCIMIQFLVSSYKVTHSLIFISQTKARFMHHLGIIRLIINDQTIIDRDEDVNFCFEESLLFAIKHIDSDTEYEKIALLLMEFKIDLNYQNTEGQTALELASEGGHAEIFRLLLLNGADPFIQRKNERFIGLNNLACTTLYRNIYRSDDIRDNCTLSVRDMLKKAIKEEGMGIYLYMYSPVVFLVEKKLRERFQLLHSCFQVLDNKFVDMSNEVLANTPLVTEAKRNYFRSYIEEEAKCNNAHQLLNLLQPHYSCLNINLLNIACMILEPIKEMVDSYNTKLKTFKDTTTLLEFVMMTSTKEMEANFGDRCSKLILKLNKSWGSKTISELNKMEARFLLPFSSFLNLIEMHQDGSSFTCTYLLPASQFQPALDIVMEKSILLHKIGVYEIFVDSNPVLMEDEDESFKFEDALQKAYQDNDEDVLFFLIELNISLPSASDIVPSVNNIESTQIMQTLLKEHNDGQTALMFACLFGHHQVVELLLSKDPDINIQDNDGWTALMLASSNGHHQVVELLLSKDPDINIQDNNGWTALMLASSNGHHQVVELLLSKDPDINIQDNDGWTALMFASDNGHHQVVELLLSKDPDINFQDNNGWTALMFASRYGHHQVVELLLSKDPDINIQNNNGWTALMFASRYGHHQVVELLLSKDPDINIQNNNGWTALMVASANGHHQVVELLLSKDPDINIQDNDGDTALIAACLYGHHQVVELLLSKDPDINIQDNNGLTALMFASGNGHHQVVELLLSKDPDINIQSNDGITALTATLVSRINQSFEYNNQLQVNCLKTLQHLLDSHPNHIHTIGGEEIHSLAVAALANNFEAIEILMSKCDISPENIISAFTIACCEGHSSITILLSKKLATLSSDERELLVAAAEGDIGTLVSILFEVGMSPDTPLVGGITPLMIAASCEHIDIVDTLIQAGADVNKTNDEGKTAFDILSGKKEGTSSYIIDLLITNGASTAAQVNPTQSLFKEIFSPLSNISLIRSMTETSTGTVERPAQINEPAQKVEELSENELAQYTQQH